MALEDVNSLLPSFSHSLNILSGRRERARISLDSFHSVIQSQELENWRIFFCAQSNVDICIELVRIREFDGSGGRIGLFKTHFFLRSRIRLIVLSCGRVRAMLFVFIGSIR